MLAFFSLVDVLGSRNGIRQTDRVRILIQYPKATHSFELLPGGMIPTYLPSRIRFSLLACPPWPHPTYPTLPVALIPSSTSAFVLSSFLPLHPSWNILPISSSYSSQFHIPCLLGHLVTNCDFLGRRMVVGEDRILDDHAFLEVEWELEIFFLL